MEFIYTITARNQGTTSRDSRVWGWYPTFDEAETHVLAGDDLLLESGTFDYLLIEEVPEGAPTLCEQQWWYKAECHRWEENGQSMFDYTVSACPCPPWAKNVTNFSMG